MLRSIPIWTVLAVAGGLIGGGDEAQGAPPLNPNGPITTAEATTYAHAVNLTAADVPGMVSVSPEGEHKERESSRAVCGIRGSHIHVVNIESPKFKSHEEPFSSGEGFELVELNSDVEVMPTAALANSTFGALEAAMRKPRVRACLARTLGQALAKQVRGHPTRGVRITFGRPGISVFHPMLPHSVGFRIVISVTYTVLGVLRIPERIYLDSVGFVVGPAQVSLTSISLSHPLPTERHLMSVLYSRASAPTP
jgi:hypothetical protein